MTTPTPTPAPSPAPEHELATLLPAPPTSGPTEHEQRRIDAGLETLLRREARAARRRERAENLAGPAVVSASFAAVVAVVCAISIGDPAPPVNRSRPVVAAPPVLAVLQQASRAMLNDNKPTVGDDQFVYTRSTVITNDGALGDGPILGSPHQREVWVSQDPDPVLEVGMIREFGQDWPMNAGAPAPVGVIRPTYEWLDSLPTDPDDLLTEIESDVALDAEGLDRDQVVFNRIGSLIAENLVPPRVAAALFDAATRIPGVTIDPNATDALGRTGLGVTRSDQTIRSVWVLDPRTYEVLGIRDYMVTPGADVLMGATAILERGVTNQSGQTPTTPTALNAPEPTA